MRISLDVTARTERAVRLRVHSDKLLLQNSPHKEKAKDNNWSPDYVILTKTIKGLQLKGFVPYLVKLGTPLHDPTLPLSKCIWGKTAHSEGTIRLAFSSRDDIKCELFKSVSSLSSTWYFIIEHFLSSSMSTWNEKLKFPWSLLLTCQCSNQ